MWVMKIVGIGRKKIDLYAIDVVKSINHRVVVHIINIL